MSSHLIARRGRRIPGHWLLALAACASPSGTEPATPDAPLSIALDTESGNAQVGRAGRWLPDSLRVVVTRDGRPAAGVRVVWSSVWGAIAGQTVTDARGEAAAAWRLPAIVGSKLLASARLAIADGGAEVSFRVSSSFPTISLVAGGGQRAEVATTLPEPIRLRVSWEGQPLVGESISWTYPSGALPAIESLESVTDSEGEISVRWTLDSIAGQQLASARLASDALIGPVLAVKAVADPGPPAGLIWEGGGLGSGFGDVWVRNLAGQFSVSATVTDRFGNPSVGAPVTFRLREESGGVFGEAIATAGTSGRAVASIAISAANAARPFRVEASAEAGAAIEAPVELFDLLFTWGAWWDELLPGAEITVPVGTTLRWASVSFEYDCRRQDGSGVGGVLGVYPRTVLEIRHDQPGSHLWACSGPASGSFWPVWIHVTP